MGIQTMYTPKDTVPPKSLRDMQFKDLSVPPQSSQVQIIKFEKDVDEETEYMYQVDAPLSDRHSNCKQQIYCDSKSEFDEPDNKTNSYTQTLEFLGRSHIPAGPNVVHFS